MRSVVCDDEAFARLVGQGGLYDHELGEKYVMAPSAGGDHAALQARVIMALGSMVDSAVVLGPTNLGILGQPGQRWYVVPDAAVIANPPPGADAYLHAELAIEIRFPREDMAAKLSDYRAVMERTGLVVEEVWYVDGEAITVHRRGAAEPATTTSPELLLAVRQAVTAWLQRG